MCRDGRPRPPSDANTCRRKVASTPKFWCEVGPDDNVKVKYGESNGEVYGEVAATRLLWALGFGADRMYPVKVICRKCPENAVKNSKPAHGERTFDPAAIERKAPGDTMEMFPDSGWGWVELELCRSIGRRRVESATGCAPIACRHHPTHRQ